jgi:DNA mismatch repair ATPase MutS
MLQQLQEDLKEENDFASLAIKKLHKISQAFDTRLNLFGWFLLNYFMLWDILQSIRLEKWRKKYGKDLEKWFSVLSELEALISLATFKYNHPQSIFPEIVNGDFIYQAQEASHPLLPPNQSVPNDISFSSLASFNIVTGANMAGKSTYLRTVGVNMILSLCGAPVLAKTCKIKPIQMFTSIRTKDNLARNESYFYAELLRLQSIINELKEGGPLFIILDEILKGTNSKDKEMGSKALVAQLIGLQAVGLIATHDLQLGSLINSFPKNVRNLCFEVDIQKDALFFDYKLREGISQNLNATFLMKKMGITGVD